MRGGYVGLMNCVFAAQKAVRFSPLSLDYAPERVDENEADHGRKSLLTC